MKYYVVIEIIEEEGPLETEVMERKVLLAKNYKEAVELFTKLINFHEK